MASRQVRVRGVAEASALQAAITGQDGADRPAGGVQPGHDRTSEDRLLDGIPLRSDGKLTVVSLAAEAGASSAMSSPLLTDIEGSTRLWQAVPDAMRQG